MEVILEHTVRTVFGTLTIETVPADGTRVFTHRKLQIGYSEGLLKPANLPHVQLKDYDLVFQCNILTFVHRIPGLLSHLPGGSNITLCDNTHLLYTEFSYACDNIRVMNYTRNGNVDATKDTFHSFTWRGKNILVRIGTDIRKYCITITPCSSSTLSNKSTSRVLDKITMLCECTYFVPVVAILIGDIHVFTEKNLL